MDIHHRNSRSIPALFFFVSHVTDICYSENYAWRSSHDYQIAKKKEAESINIRLARTYRDPYCTKRLGTGHRLYFGLKGIFVPGRGKNEKQKVPT